MDERAEKSEKPEEPDAAKLSAGDPAAAPTEISGSNESNLPVVWSPPLDARVGLEEEPFDIEAEPASLGDEPAHDEPAQEEAQNHASDASAAAAPPRTWRFALLAATIALAAALGSVAGSLTVSGVGGMLADAAPGENTTDAIAILRALKSQVAELAAIKSNLDGAIRNANTQFVAIADRLDRVERASASPAAQLAHIADTVDRLSKLNTVPETTSSIATMATAPSEAKLTDRIVENWVVQDVHGDRALVESRSGGLFEVSAGSVLPGLGRVETVKRLDGQWVVVTARGLITSGR